MIRVAVSGSGQMGRMVLDAVEAQDDMQAVGLLEPLAALAGTHRLAGGTEIPTFTDARALFEAQHPDVIVDFTNAAYTATLLNATEALPVRLVVGTSGVATEVVAEWKRICEEHARGGVYAANFAIGAVLLMHMAALAARFFDSAEVIELHHDRKVDSPSGTALATARAMRAARGADFVANTPELEHLPHARGAAHGGVAIHSVRLPGYVASQEVLFGGLGQTLSLRHDSIGRESFMPGVMLAVREVMRRQQLVLGLDSLIGL